MTQTAIEKIDNIKRLVSFHSDAGHHTFVADMDAMVALVERIEVLETGPKRDFGGLSAMDLCYQTASNKRSVPSDVVLAAIDEIMAKVSVVMERCGETTS